MRTPQPIGNRERRDENAAETTVTRRGRQERDNRRDNHQHPRRHTGQQNTR